MEWKKKIQNDKHVRENAKVRKQKKGPCAKKARIQAQTAKKRFGLKQGKLLGY